MKQRFSALDVSAILPDLRGKLIGLRLQNIYDVNSKTFLFKFTKADEKHVLLIESGTRMHTTEFTREKNDTPTAFCAKLRKHIKTRRLTSITQLGMDRVVDFKLGEEEFAYHIIVEFYSSGTQISIDIKYRILTLLRKVTLQGNTSTAPDIAVEDTKFAVGQTYNFKLINQVSEISLDKLKSSLTNLKQDSEPRKKKDDTIKKVLRHALGQEYGSALVDHVLTNLCIPVSTKMSKEELLADSALLLRLVEGFKEADEIIKQCMINPQKGFILIKHFSFGETQVQSTPLLVNPSITDISQKEPSTADTYEEFNPCNFSQYKSLPFTSVNEYSSFNTCVDIYFSLYESQKNLLKHIQADQNSKKKLSSVLSSHTQHIESLEKSTITSTQRAQAIEANIDVVENSLGVIRGLIASGMDWKDVWGIVQEEKRKLNPLASYITALKLDAGILTLSLPVYKEFFSDEDSIEDEDDKVLNVNVDIDIYSSAHANARKYYDLKKTYASKKEKTIEHSAIALESAQQKILSELAKQKTSLPSAITKKRIPFTFEKYKWCVSSQNYLLLSPNDSVQSRTLIGKHLGKGDVFVCSDVPNTLPVIIKNSFTCTPRALLQEAIECGLICSDSDVPRATLEEAGIMVQCNSNIWSTKGVMRVWWVHAYQVMSDGSVSGVKNYIENGGLVYGFGVLFVIGRESVERHLWERRPWARGRSNDIGYNEKFGNWIGESDLVVEDEDNNLENLEATAEEEDVFPDTQIAEFVDLVDVQATPVIQTEGNTSDIIEKVEILSVNENTGAGSGGVYEKDHEGNKHLSAKQRRDLKKKNISYGPLNSSSTSTPTLSKLQPKADVTPVESLQLPRGKLAKLKKLEKYKDQDSEDRAAMLELLGSDRGPQPKGKKAKTAAMNEAALKKKHEEYEKRKAERERLRIEKEGSEVEIAVKSVKSDERVAIELKDNGASSDWNVLDYLTGSPNAEDVLEHAIVVSGPWISLQKFKYKVKLIPGSTKRGKAVKSVISDFSSQATKASDIKEGDLIKAIPESELVATMIGKVKVVSKT